MADVRAPSCRRTHDETVGPTSTCVPTAAPRACALSKVVSEPGEAHLGPGACETMPRPAGRRTTFSVTLQLARSVADLVELVGVKFDPVTGRAAMMRIAATILRGSHRRAHEQLPALVDQQRRVDPLAEARSPTRRGFATPKTSKRKQKVAA